MSLRTLRRDAPSSFKHSIPAGTRVLLFSALSVLLMLADVRLKLTEPVRQAVSAVLFPVQWAAMRPVEWFGVGQSYFEDLSDAQGMAVDARKQMTAMLLKVQEAERDKFDESIISYIRRNYGMLIKPLS